MHKQPLAQHLEETQRQLAQLQQLASAIYPQQHAAITQIFSTINGAIANLERLEAEPPIDDADAQAVTGDHAPGYDPALLPDMYAAHPQAHEADAYCANEEALRHQLQITRTITNNATACLFMVDAEGRCTFMNPAAEDVTGYSFAEVQGKILHNLIHHSRPDGTPYPIDECPISRALPEQTQLRAHADLFIRKDGSFFPVVCAISPIIQDGIPIGIVVEARDISESKRIERERERLFKAEQRAVSRARHQADQLRGLMAASIAINGLLSVNEMLQLITQQARQVIGAHQAVSSLSVNDDWEQAITTVSLSDKYSRWHSYDAPPSGAGIYAEVCKTNVPMRMTQAELEAHPAWRGFSDQTALHPPLRGWLAAPFITHDGRNIGLIQLSDKYEGDFTAEDEYVVVQFAQMASGALENARLYTAAQEAIRVRNEFLSVASHELNTPVTSLRGYAQLLGRQIDKGQVVDSERALRALKAIEQQSIKLGQLINQLLDISRIESGRLILNCQPTEITRLTEDVAANLQTTTSKHELMVEANGPAIISADPLRLEQVLTNLIGNAIKYSPEGGRVHIEIGRPDDQMVEISVTDQGIGIPPEHRPHIFDRFYQAHGSGYFGGMGLGLSISQQIVALHGGELLADFPAQGGTRFVVRLPSQRQAT
jgi:PAS domain S-box-containing protein